MASGAVTPDFQVPIQVYDSQGGLHTLTMSFLEVRPEPVVHRSPHAAPADIVAGGGNAA